MNHPVPEFVQAAAKGSNATLMARRQNALPRGVSQSHSVFISHAHNSEIWDVEGRRHIDFAGGIAVLNTGHSHPEITAAVQRQIENFSHTCFQVVAYESYVELAEKLNAMAPAALSRRPCC